MTDAIKGFAGFDACAFPGHAVMAWLRRNTDLAFCGFYLAPAPSHPDTGWMAARAQLAADGWGFLPIFVGRQLAGPGARLTASAALAADQGRQDGQLAAALMAAAGFPRHSRLFLDLEDGAPFAEPRVSYVRAWAAAVQHSYPDEPGVIGWHAGVYCSHAIGEAVREALVAIDIESPQIWAFKVATTQPHWVAGPFADDFVQDPADAFAFVIQHDQNALIDIGTPGPGRQGMMVDLSTSVFADPSAP